MWKYRILNPLFNFKKWYDLTKKYLIAPFPSLSFTNTTTCIIFFIEVTLFNTHLEFQKLRSKPVISFVMMIITV